MTSAYARCPSVRTTLGVWGKKLSRIWRGVPDVYVAFRFGAKLTILGATIGIVQVKI